MKRLNILLVTDSFFPIIGGVQTIVDKSAVALSKYCNVTVATTRYKNYDYEKKPYKLLCCKGFYNSITNDGMSYPSLDKKFVKELKNGQFDIIHCHTPGNLYRYMLKFGKKNNIPVISTIHNKYYEDALKIVKVKWLAKAITKSFMKIANKSDNVWVISDYSYNYLQSFGLRKDCLLVRNCIDLKPVEDSEKRKQEIYQKHNISKDKIIFLNVGRLIQTKNIDLILNSVKLLRKNTSNFIIIMVGDGSYAEEFKNKVEDNNLKEYFIFTGSIKDRNLLSSYFCASDIILFPSIIEAAGLGPVEGSTFKKPTITIENYPAAEGIIDKENGFLCQNTPVSFCDTMYYCIKNIDICKKVGEKAFKTIYRCYENEENIKELIQNYNKEIENYKNKKTLFEKIK